MKNEDRRIIALIVLGLIISTFFGIGFVAGMIYQQLLITKQIDYLFDYADIEVNVNFNETKIVQEINDTFVPIWEEEYNKSIEVNES